MSDYHMEPAEFVTLATRILEANGEPCPSRGRNAFRYEDDLVIVTSNSNGLGLEIERKAQPQSEETHLHVSNPVTMVDRNGEVIRHHGEHAHITNHLLALVAQLDANPAP